jgi:ATP-dependent protease ClpP protease subunit
VAFGFSYFLKHWKGELPLSVSYWLNCFGITVLLSAFGRFVFSKSSDLNSAFGLGFLCFLMLLYLFAVFLITIWQNVGLWRAANEYNKKPKASMWGDVAKLGVVIGTLHSFADFITYHLPQSKELISIVSGDKGIPPFTITVLPGGKDLFFQGGIRSGSANEFKRILEAVPQATVLQIDSVGGRISEAKKIGDLVKARGMSTFCSGTAQSAASLILMNGRKRYVTPDARVGFHAGSFPGATKEMSEAMDSEIEEIMQRGGVSKAFIKKVLATPNSSMWFPSFEEMLEAGFITDQSFGEGFASQWGMPGIDLEGIFENLEKKQNVYAFKTCAPEEYKIMKEEVILALRSGKSEVEAISIVNETTKRIYLSLISFASDQAINILTNETLSFLKKHVKTNPKGCIYFLKGANVNLARVFPEALHDEGLQAASAGIIFSAKNKILKPIDIQKAEQQNEHIWQEIFHFFGDRAAIISEQDQWEQNADFITLVFIKLYSLIQNLTNEDSANYMRWLLCYN